MTWPPENKSWIDLVCRMLRWRFVFVLSGWLLSFYGVFSGSGSAFFLGVVFMLIGAVIYDNQKI